MCAPLTHLYFAKKISQVYFSNIDHFAYYAGTTFPDIRYYANKPRGITHDLSMKISRLTNASDWTKGWGVHSILDKIHQEYMIVADNKLIFSRPRYMALVALEDHVFYEDAKSILDLEKYEQTDFPEEMTFGIEREVIQQYRVILRKQLSVDPTIEAHIESLKLTVPEVTYNGFLDQLVENYNEINNDKVIGIIKKFDSEFLNLVSFTSL